MTKKQLEYFKTKLQNLNPDEQIEIAKLLSDELYQNNQAYNCDANYNHKLADHIIYMLEIYISSSKKKQLINELHTMMEKFKQLPKEKQERVAKAAFNTIKKIEQEEKQKIAELTCKEQGHVFEGKYKGWTDHSFTRLETINYDHQIFEAPVEHKIWKRTCTRCGYEEVLKDKEPEIVTKAKKEAARKRRIKELQDELDLLTKNNKKKK